MRLLIWLLFALLGVVQAISSAGPRLLVVQEDETEKSAYSKFWADLQGLGVISWHPLGTDLLL